MTISAAALLFLITIFITVLSILDHFEVLIILLMGEVCVYAEYVCVCVCNNFSALDLLAYTNLALMRSHTSR